MTVNGSYRPIVADVAGDDYADILWYAPGTAPDSLWVSTNTPGTFAPEPVTKAIKTAHPEARVKEAELVEIPEGGPLYEVEISQGKEDSELRYDAKGTLLRTEADKEKSEDEEDND